MNEDIEFIELLDLRNSGRLSTAAVAELERRIKDDSRLAEIASEHEKFVTALNRHQSRRLLSAQLNIIHDELSKNETGEKVLPSKFVSVTKYWITYGIAAAIALISVAGTLWLTQRPLERQKIAYQELRRNVEQIKKSQSIMMEKIDQSKTKAIQVPGKFAGTGFLISANGYVVTSYHVIKQSDSVYIENEKWGAHKTSIVYNDAENDIAILQISSDAFKTSSVLPFSVEDEEANVGERAFTLGFPREEIVYGEGSISAATGFKQNTNAYQISVPVNPGNSGGPLLNENGDLIGIISGIQTATIGAAFAIKSSILLQVISQIPKDSIHRPLKLSQLHSLRGKPRVQQIRQWKEFVCVVKVYK